MIQQKIDSTDTAFFSTTATTTAQPSNGCMETAIVYCENNFGKIDGKTANGLVRHSEKYKILAIIDSTLSGQDAGEVLEESANGIPIYKDLGTTLAHLGKLPDHFIFGIAPATGVLSLLERRVMLRAIGYGMNIVNGLHEFLNDDPEFIAASEQSNIRIRDVRKPRDKKELRVFSGAVEDINCLRIAVLGTDCAIGKRTTASILAQALNERGIEAILIGTGQTGLMQGARYGLALDAVPSQFCAGELEGEIIRACEQEAPKVILIEGQGALSHPAYSTSSFILRGSCPQAVILQHAPGREHRCDFEHMPMPKPKSEVNLIETFSNTKVIGLTLNHENMSEEDIHLAIEEYQNNLKIPVTDALKRPSQDLVDMVFRAFPHLGGATANE